MGWMVGVTLGVGGELEEHLLEVGAVRPAQLDERYADLVRDPRDAGMALAQALLLPNWFAGLAGLAGFGFLFYLRLGPEERMMEQRFGEAYVSYKSRTDRIIPGIW